VLPPERELTESFGVGRSSIREALRMLESQGVISAVNGGSFVVAEAANPLNSSLRLMFTLDDRTGIHDLFELRRILEVEAAGRCGLGVLGSANERNVWGVGSGVDAAALGPQILTSAVKHVDVAVLATIRAMQDRSLRTGVDSVFDVANGGVGLGAVSRRVPEATVVTLRAEELRLASGVVPNIPTTVR